jgi:CheY-like chemotaxis protein
MEAMGLLAGGVAHDFNNLLTVISGYADLLLLRQGDADAARAEALEIQRAAAKASSLAAQLLALGREQPVEPHELDVGAVLAQMQELLRRALGETVRLIIVRAKGLGQVRTDRTRIEQVIMSLAINAREAMSGSGQVTIEVSNAELGVDSTWRHLRGVPGPQVMLSVSDTGPGMDEDARAHVFEPFHAGRGRGSGLALASVYTIVKQLGGALEVVSDPGRGSTFKVFLPRVDVPGEEAHAPAPTPRGAETILLVEDQVELLTLARRILESQGYSVLAACDGADAIAVSEQYEGPIHLLIADVVMPYVGGRELAARLVRQRPGLQVLLMSGYASTPPGGATAVAGKTEFLRKPFTAEALLSRVRTLLDAVER